MFKKMLYKLQILKKGANNFLQCHKASRKVQRKQKQGNLALRKKSRPSRFAPVTCKIYNFD